MRTALVVAAASFLAACSPASPDPASPDPAGEGGGAAEPAQTEPTSTAATSAPTAEPPVACTRIGCMDGLEIAFTPEAPKAGTYSITVTAGSDSSTCEVVFPYPKCGTPATKCAGSIPMMVTETGCELPKDKQTFPKVRMGKAPAEIQIAVKLGKATLSDQKVTPTYEELRPNGPKCDPVCKQGKASVSLEKK